MKHLTIEVNQQNINMQVMIQQSIRFATDPLMKIYAWAVKFH